MSTILRDDFEADCRAKFVYYCRRCAESPFHAEKKMYAIKAFEQIDAYLDWRDVQTL